MKKLLFTLIFLTNLSFADEISATLQKSIKCNESNQVIASINESFTLQKNQLQVPKGSKIIGKNQNCIVRWDKVILPKNGNINIEKQTLLSEIVSINKTKTESDILVQNGTKIIINYYPSFIQTIKN